MIPVLKLQLLMALQIFAMAPSAEDPMMPSDPLQLQESPSGELVHVMAP